MNEAQFDDVVSGLYRAATGATSWAKALDPVAEMFRARLAVIHRVDSANHCLLAQESGGEAGIEDGVLQYIREYHLVDPRRQHLFSAEIVLKDGPDQQDGSAARTARRGQGNAREAARAKRPRASRRSNRRLNRYCTWPR